MGGGGHERNWRTEGSLWMPFVNMLGKKNLLPVVVFCFSKNRCDQSADGLTGADLTSKPEKSEIVQFCDRAFSRLKGSDRRLPQVLRISDLLKRGIGVHHAGLLPIVKEVVEMLFCRGVIKVLFSTETFAMGVNAPARTVAFHSLKKHDGRTFRQLLSGEYTQMAGRAGRRGLDLVGTVIICCWDEVPLEGDLRRLLTGQPTKLESQFRLTYTMILNLLRVEDLTVEDMLKRSFAEFHAMKSRPEMQEALKRHEAALVELRQGGPIQCILGEPTIEEYVRTAVEERRLRGVLQEGVINSRSGQQALVPGRCVMASLAEDEAPVLSVIVKGPLGEGATRAYLLLLLHQEPPEPQKPSPDGALPGGSRREPQALGGITVLGTGPKGPEIIKLVLPYFGQASGSAFGVRRVEVGCIAAICRPMIQLDVAGMLNEENLAAFASAVQQLERVEQEHLPGAPPAVPPQKELKLNNAEVVRQYEQHEKLQQSLARNKCFGCMKLGEHYRQVQRQTQLRQEAERLRHLISDASLQQMPEFEQRVGVLQHLGYLDESRVVQLKGRVACEMNSGDELISTEAMFDNQLDTLEAAEAVALLSSLVFQQSDASEPMLTETLAAARDRLYQTALRLGKVQTDFDLNLVPEEYAASHLKFGLMEVVYEWAKGTPFADICELTNVPEGSIVRTIMRLDETCREFRNAARLVGDSALFQKMEEASAAIKRDIVFAASLYVTGGAPKD